jgi:hypothetical protein
LSYSKRYDTPVLRKERQRTNAKKEESKAKGEYVQTVRRSYHVIKSNTSIWEGYSHREGRRGV